MATIESQVTTKAGEFPYGPLHPLEVAIASGTVRALMQYRLAIEAGSTALLPDADLSTLQQTQHIAQSRLTRAILGSMRCLPQPISSRLIHTSLNDPEATGACNDQAEAQQLYELRTADIADHAQKQPYGCDHEAVLEAALLYAADSATHEWQRREVQDIAAARGYAAVLALLDVTFAPPPATIEVYARAS